MNKQIGKGEYMFMGSSSSGDKVLAVLAHVSYFFLPILLPLVLVLAVKEEGFVRHHARQALVFHLALLGATIIAWILCLVLIGFVLLWAICIYGLVMTILAVVRTVEGEYYRYPLTARWFR